MNSSTRQHLAAVSDDVANEATPGATRLLAGLHRDRPLSFEEHEAVHGRLVLGRPARSDRTRMVEVLRESGLGGRGGAGFPFARKVDAVLAARGKPVVVVNLAESEPASRKDAVLATHTPHLILDGAQVVASIIGAREVVLWLHQEAEPQPIRTGLEWAVTQRRDAIPFRLVSGPSRYVSGQAAAVVRALSGGPAAPTLDFPAIYKRGVNGQPTLLSNAETFAHIALIARHGALWFRGQGTSAEPGTTLATLVGGVAQPGVVEVALGQSIGDIVAAAGGVTKAPQAVLIGGYEGRWLPWDVAQETPLTRADLRAAGADLGVAMIGVLPHDACALAETSRIATWLAGESAGQCGPCVNGLPAMARALNELVTSRNPAAESLLRRWSGQVRGRGACHHPDGVAGLIDSALTVFADDVSRHCSSSHPSGSQCAGMRAPRVFDIPAQPRGFAIGRFERPREVRR